MLEGREAEAAAVAARLKAFQAHPASMARLYTHGVEPLPDGAIVLCNQVENSVFVIESGKTRKGHAKAALKRLHQAGVHPLGVILTKIDAYHDLYGYHSYYYQYAKPALAAKESSRA